MQTKKILSIFLSALMIMSVASFHVIADNGEIVYFNHHFNEPGLPSGLSLRNNYDCIDVLGDGILKMYYKPTMTASACYLNIDSIKATTGTIPELVIEYKSRNQSTVRSGYMSDNGTKLITYGAESYFEDKNNVAWNLASNDPVITTVDDISEWHTYSIVYSNIDNTRSLYIDGVYIATTEDAAGNNPWFTGNGKAGFTFKLYDGNKKDYAEFEYIKAYSPGEEMKMEVNSGSYNLDTVYLQFDTVESIVDITPEMISIDGMYADEVRIADEENQKFEVVFPEDLDASTDYTVSVEGVKTSLGKLINEEVSFETRAKEFYIDDLKATSGEVEIPGVIIGDAEVSGWLMNELDDPQTVSVMAVQYGPGGYLLKDNIFSKDYIVPKVSEVEVFEDIIVDATAKSLSTYAWKGAETPIPVSDIRTYGNEEISETNLTYGISGYTGNADIDVVIKNDYSGVTVTVSTGESDVERVVGILVKYKDSVEYMANAKTSEGKVVFDIPLHEENIGTYMITAGLEKADKAIETQVEFYSPDFIKGQMNEKINSAEADAESGAAFVDLLGNYLKMDMEAYGKLADTSVVFDKLYNLRDENEEKVFEAYGDVVTAFSTAVKMALIYEGKETADILSKSADMPVDELTKQVISEDISTSAKQYLADSLKGKEYGLPSELVNDAKYYTIIGGVAKSEHYKQVRAIINAYGEEIGINLVSYNSLKYPENVDKAVQQKEYTSLEAFASAVNSAITTQARKEAAASSSSGSSGGGGGGGGGSRVSSSVKYPTVTEPKEENKEEVKEETPVKTYSDVKTNDWFHSDVMWATEKGMFIGTSETTFSPAMNLTWEQIAIVLGRIGHTLENKNGSADISRGDFAEVLFGFLADKAQYKTRDEWIAGTKIFIGDQNGDMMFEKTLTRAECCTVLRRIESK